MRSTSAFWLRSAVTFAVACAFVAPASAAPMTAHLFPIQGVVRDVFDAPITSGDVTVRIYADSIGGSPLYDSASEFAGAVAGGIFDVIAGQNAPLTLDAERLYYLELDVAGSEAVGDASGGRWAFYPDGGNRACVEVEARIHALEVAMGISSLAKPAPGDALRFPSIVLGVRDKAAFARGGSATMAGAYSDQHALLGLASMTGTDGAITVHANLLATPIGRRSAGGNRTHLGPTALFAPFPNPMIRVIDDVPNDQGLAVHVRWSADLRERPHNPFDTLPRITSYTLYRRLAPGQAALGRMEPEQAALLPPGNWDAVTSVPATLDSTYETALPTLCDSTTNGVCRSVLLVRAMTDQVGVFYNSVVDSGYSIDNLAPEVPQGLAVQPVVGGASVSWQASTAPDFLHFRIYRDTDPQFTPGPGNLVNTTTSTEWTDPTIGPFTYKVTAVDANGNESPPASATVTLGASASAPQSLGFASLAPNPFHGALTLSIDVPRGAGTVELTLFDLAGRKVRSLIRRPLDPGRYTYTWDGRAQNGNRVAPGIYAARLSGAGRVLTRRATLLP